MYGRKKFIATADIYVDVISSRHASDIKRQNHWIQQARTCITVQWNRINFYSKERAKPFIDKAKRLMALTQKGKKHLFDMLFRQSSWVSLNVEILMKIYSNELFAEVSFRQLSVGLHFGKLFVWNVTTFNEPFLCFGSRDCSSLAGMKYRHFHFSYRWQYGNAELMQYCSSFSIESRFMLEYWNSNIKYYFLLLSIDIPIQLWTHNLHFYVFSIQIWKPKHECEKFTFLCCFFCSSPLFIRMAQIIAIVAFTRITFQSKWVYWHSFTIFSYFSA